MRYRSINNCNQIWRIEFKIAAKCKEKENQEKKTVIEWLSCYWYDKLVQPVRPESTAARGDFINKSEQFDLVTKDHSLVRLPLYSFFFISSILEKFLFFFFFYLRIVLRFHYRFVPFRSIRPTCAATVYQVILDALRLDDSFRPVCIITHCPGWGPTLLYAR